MIYAKENNKCFLFYFSRTFVVYFSFLELFHRNQIDGPTEFIVQIPRHLLQVEEKLGEGEFGEVTYPVSLFRIKIAAVYVDLPNEI